MSKEYEMYRENLALIREFYPDKMLLSLKETAALVGRKKDNLLLDEAFPAFKVGGHYAIPITDIAKWLCGKNYKSERARRNA